jgi:hypothetical protein
MTILTGILIAIWNWWKGTSPIVSACVSGFLFALWSVGFGLLANAMNTTITRPCTIEYWGTDEGVNVCTLYKVLFAGAGAGV